MKRTSCSGCGHTDLEMFLDLGTSPLADAYTATPTEISPQYPLQVAVCAKCHLAQLTEALDTTTLFGTGYSFYSSASAPLSAYHERYAADALDRHGDLSRRGVVEVGCNDGDLLRHFAAAGCPTLGVDPAAGPAAVAADRGLDVLVEPFGADTAIEGAGVIIANHVLAHVQDVAGVLAGIRRALAPDGVALVEVQYLPDLLVNNAFDLVYHEHLNFFSLSSLEQATLRQGLHIIDAQLTDRQGGSLRVTLSGNPQPSQAVDTIRESERWLNGWGAYESMQGRAERIRARLWDLLAGEVLSGRNIAGYGAPAKATTLLNWCGIDSRAIGHMVDTTQAKQGRHIPCTGIPIVAPDARPDPDTYLLLAWNYAGPIMRNNPGPRWIVPLPAPVVL